MKGTEVAQQIGGVPIEAVAGDSPTHAEVPFWITACIRLLPPRRRNGAEVAPSLANAVLLALQGLAAFHASAGEKPGNLLNRGTITRLCGLNPNKASWLFDYLELLGVLRTHHHHDQIGRGRRPDSFTICLTPPTHYIGPKTDVELDDALLCAAQGHPPVLFADESCARHAAFVYVIAVRDSSTFKIGVTRDVTRRLKQLQTSAAAALELRWHARGGYELEQQLHAHFDRHRSHGEWFSFKGSGDHVARIRQVALRLGAVEVTA